MQKNSFDVTVSLSTNEYNISFNYTHDKNRIKKHEILTKGRKNNKQKLIDRKNSHITSTIFFD